MSGRHKRAGLWLKVGRRKMAEPTEGERLFGLLLSAGESAHSLDTQLFGGKIQLQNKEAILGRYKVHTHTHTLRI